MKRVWASALTSGLLSVLFVVVYGVCNLITSMRSHVGSIVFAWEHSIPFIPWLILPYMSIDLFFVAAPFVTRTDRERHTLAKRITAAILVAGTCFLMFPLRFAFERPNVDGMLGVLFNNFRTMDLPFNEFPSLHVALCFILGEVYFRHTRGWVRRGLALWFVLIGLSPLMTYQHHVIDVLGGFVPGGLCIHLFNEAPLRLPFARNLQIGKYYAGAAAVLAILALAWRPWSWLLFWPAASLAVVAAGYAFLGPGLFRKERGKLTWTTWLLLGPVLLGQRFSRMYYARQCHAYDRVTDRLWIGRHLSNHEARELRGNGIIAVLDLAPEFSDPRPFRELSYLNVAVLDLSAPTLDQIDQAVDFIGQHVDDGGVYVHCKIGYSRTAVMTSAYLLASGHVNDVAQAVAVLRQARPTMIVRPEALSALAAWVHHRSLSRAKSAV